MTRKYSSFLVATSKSIRPMNSIHDAQREDVVTFVFQLWLFVLALVTVRQAPRCHVRL